MKFKGGNSNCEHELNMDKEYKPYQYQCLHCEAKMFVYPIPLPKKEFLEVQIEAYQALQKIGDFKTELQKAQEELEEYFKNDQTSELKEHVQTIKDLIKKHDAFDYYKDVLQKAEKNLEEYTFDPDNLNEYNRYSTFFYELNRYAKRISKYKLYRVENPITEDWLKRAKSARVVFKKDLKKDHFYYGHCRNSNLALWDGEKFIYVREKLDNRFLTNINHFEDDNGYDLFVPHFELSEDMKLITHIKEHVEELLAKMKN